jgi:hypothetical protein
MLYFDLCTPSSQANTSPSTRRDSIFDFPWQFEMTPSAAQTLRHKLNIVTLVPPLQALLFRGGLALAMTKSAQRLWSSVSQKMEIQQDAGV